MLDLHAPRRKHHRRRCGLPDVLLQPSLYDSNLDCGACDKKYTTITSVTSVTLGEVTSVTPTTGASRSASSNRVVNEPVPQNLKEIVELSPCKQIMGVSVDDVERDRSWTNVFLTGSQQIGIHLRARIEVVLHATIRRGP